jgi:hypothetical protein
VSEGPYRRRWQPPGSNRPGADGRYRILLIFITVVVVAIWGLHRH